jgi:hypothetical protein
MALCNVHHMPACCDLLLVGWIKAAILVTKNVRFSSPTVNSRISAGMRPV